jgi:hypothetical protein
MMLSSPGAWKFGMAGLQGVDWAALWPAFDGHPDRPRLPALVERAEAAVLSTVRAAKAAAKTQVTWEQARALDPKASSLKAYELIDPETEVFR